MTCCSNGKAACRGVSLLRASRHPSVLDVARLTSPSTNGSAPGTSAAGGGAVGREARSEADPYRKYSESELPLWPARLSPQPAGAAKELPEHARDREGEDVRSAAVEGLAAVSGSTARPDACTSWTSSGWG